jgi:hypothetical protein
MATDILCGPEGHPDFAIVQARVLKVEGSDVIIDSAERRTANSPSFRRALVHDQGDGLTINFGNDYPGGVTLNGVASITPQGQKGGSKKFPLAHHIPTLVVNGDISYEVGGITIEGQPTSIAVSVSSKIAELSDAIAKLSARVTALGG